MQTWENGENPICRRSLGLQKFVRILSLLVRYRYKISPYAIENKTNEPNLRKWQQQKKKK